MFFKVFNSGSIKNENVDKQTSSSTVEVKKVISTSTDLENDYADRKQSSSDIRTSVCFFMHSGGVMPEKPPMLQETVLSSEKWYGRTIEVEENSIVVDVRKAQNLRKRLKLRVRKDKIEGDLDRLNDRTGVVVNYMRVRNYQGTIEKRFSVRLREPADMPDAILEREFQARMKRFSYMFLEE